MKAALIVAAAVALPWTLTIDPRCDVKPFSDFLSGQSTAKTVVSPRVAAAPQRVNVREYVRIRASRSGWTGTDWKCLARLIERESSWRPHVKNSQGSSAYGLFQLLKMKPGTPVSKQVDAGFRYLQSRYHGEPCLALEHHLAKGWY